MMSYTLCRPRQLFAAPHRVSMLTRRANRVRGLREAALSLPLLGPLPGDLVKLILRLLPLDARLRAREVRRGWCALLEDASFWTHVDLRKSCGVNPRFLTPRYGVERHTLALLRAACVRAKDNLQSVDLSGVRYTRGGPFIQQWLDSASAADKASLCDLVAPLCYPSLNLEQVTAVCRTLPLCRVRCTVYCTAVEALPLLRREPPFALLTICKLLVFNEEGEQAVLNLASALTVHKGMEQLSLYVVPLTRAVVDALVDAAISAGIIDVSFHECGLSQTALPALTRLIQAPGFEQLRVDNDNLTLLEGPALPAFCEALRNCTSLRKLELYFVHLWHDMAVATQLIAALEGLPALQELSTVGNSTDRTPAMQRAVGECLAPLIAHSTSLRVQDVSENQLGEAGLAPIFEALRGDSGLAELFLDEEQISADFACDVVLTAVRANTSLRELSGLRWVDAPEFDEDEKEEEELLPELQELGDILAARRQAEEEAA